MLLNRVANELLTMSVTLSRAATLAPGQPEVQALADVYCAGARHRLADWWRQATDGDEPDYGLVAGSWLKDCRPGLMLDGILTTLPSVDVLEDVR
jgi:hypothetical protein